MTNYTKSTNFASKDSLPIGNALKIVKGTEIDTEFNSIAAAVATKADLTSPIFVGSPSRNVNPPDNDSSLSLATTNWVQNELATEVIAINADKAPKESPAFTGIPTAPTAAVNNNTTQLATTAFVAAKTAGVGIGVGQTWGLFSSGRVIGTTYINFTDKPIMVNVRTESTGANSYSTLLVDGIPVSYVQGDSTNGNASATLSAIVPKGSSYIVTGNRTLSGSSSYWSELR